ncbi:MAG: bifunctional DNA-formamidopyrimidine glycosylase/DNA-(apurinic or apyrimidinic site) lyase [Gemmatimonadetes bacterium]|nr:bifunctional DNA-formamidopyrimidine glycosylase/DNA-(apurinic or apyrimidinic site) lyase [Gemmatimonadota bacterium]
MPELPEAETIVRGLRRSVVGERIRRVETPHPDVLRTSPRSFGARVRGRRIEGVGRRGKNVLLRLEGGRIIAVNLGMTGALLPFLRPPRGPGSPTHPAVVFRFDSGAVLVFDDQRRFGTVEALDAAQWEERHTRMGPEPLEEDFTAEALHRALRRSVSPIRSWLLDQRRIAGVGNIYASEALHLAGIHPARRARTVTAGEARLLREAIRDVLQAAIDFGGTTIRDYRNADGQAGEYGRRLHVYGREDEPCMACGAGIRRTVISNRSAYFCPSCQPRRGGARRR